MKSSLRLVAFFTFVAIALVIAPGEPGGNSIDGNGFTATRYAAGKGAHFVAIADLNGDGNLDIAVANKDSEDVTILLGDGRGHFRPAPGSPFAAGHSPNDIAVGDFNGDQKPDLVIVNHDTPYLTLLLGEGRGQFTAAPKSPFRTQSKPHPHGVAVADFNRDGRLDLVTDSADDDKIEFLLGDGKGGFATPGSRFSVGRQPYQRVRVGDFNKDGNMDVVTTNLDGASVSVLLGNGAGGFREATGSPFQCGAKPFGVAVGDLNGDGNADLAIVNWNGKVADPQHNTLTVLLGDGRDSFQPMAGSPFHTGRAPCYVALGDVNGDGLLDVVVVNAADDSVSLFFSKRGGRLVKGPTVAVGRRPFGVAVGDLNGDGKADIVTANSGDNDITVLLSK
jgi:hypothetical protein